MNIYPQIENTRNFLNNLGNAVSEFVNSLVDVFEEAKMKTYLDNFRKAHHEAYSSLLNPTLSIAIIGITSSGKSTIFNALTGRRITPMKAEEFSCGILSLKDSKDNKLIINQTLDAVWETGEWTNLTDDELYHKIQKVMYTYHRTKKSQNLIPPQIKVYGSLFPTNNFSISGFPEGIEVEFFDFPPLQFIDNQEVLPLLNSKIGNIFCLVVLDYLQIVQQENNLYLEEFKKLFEYLQVDKDSIIFILNKVDQKGFDDTSIEILLDKIKKEIKQELLLSDLPNIIPLNSRLFYYAQCAWGTNSLGTESNINQETRKKLLENLFIDCAKTIKINLQNNQNLQTWFYQVEKNLTENNFIDDNTIQRILCYALEWSGGKNLWSSIRDRLNKYSSRFIISPTISKFINEYKIFSIHISNFIDDFESTNKNILQQELEKNKNDYQNNLTNKEKEYNDFKSHIKNIVTYCQHYDINQYIEITKNSTIFTKEEIDFISQLFNFIPNIERDLTETIIAPIYNFLDNKDKNIYLPIEDNFLIQEIRNKCENYRLIMQNNSKTEEDEKCLRMLFSYIKEALIVRTNDLIQCKQDKFKEFLKYFIKKQYNSSDINNFSLTEFTENINNYLEDNLPLIKFSKKDFIFQPETKKLFYLNNKRSVAFPNVKQIGKESSLLVKKITEKIWLLLNDWILSETNNIQIEFVGILTKNKELVEINLRDKEKSLNNKINFLRSEYNKFVKKTKSQ